MKIADNANVYSARSGSRKIPDGALRRKHKVMLKHDLCA